MLRLSHARPLTQVAIGSKRYDQSCKLIADRLYKSAQRMKLEVQEWLKEQLADEKTCKRLMDAYRRVCPEELVQRGAKPANFLLQFSEYIKTENAIHIDDTGDMLDQADYIQWAATKNGGNMSGPAAVAKFERLVTKG